MGDDGDRLLRPPSWDPTFELFRLCRVREHVGKFLISTNGTSSSESVCCGVLSLSPVVRKTKSLRWFRKRSSSLFTGDRGHIPVFSISIQSSSSSSWVDINLKLLIDWSVAPVKSWFSCIISVEFLLVLLPRMYDARELNIIQSNRALWCFQLMCCRRVDVYRCLKRCWHTRTQFILW